jgi:branched-chain amino acid aminotransferase
MLNQQGYVTEGTTFNIWGVTGQRLITPPLESGLLMGITRRQIIEIAHAASMEIVEQEMTAEQLLTMDEVFVSGSIKNILPVYRLNHRVFDGPRPVTMKLQKLYADHCAEYVRKHRQWQTFR